MNGVVLLGERSGILLMLHFEKRSRSLFYQFETAWSPPLPVVKELAKRFPTLTLKIKYFEYGVGYQGSNLYEEGILVEEKTTDYHGNRGG